MHADNDFVDRLLDTSLAGYSAAVPRPGLEQRVLARLLEEPASAGWPAWRWLPVSALAAVALLVAALIMNPRATQPPETVFTPPAITPAVPLPAAPTSPPVVAIQSPALRRTPRETPVSGLVRADQFPRPTSLTEEERRLMSYLDSAPREVLVAAARTGAGRNQPLSDLLVRDVEVPMLELKPLPEQSGEAMQN